MVDEEGEVQEVLWLCLCKKEFVGILGIVVEGRSDGKSCAICRLGRIFDTGLIFLMMKKIWSLRLLIIAVITSRS